MSSLGFNKIIDIADFTHPELRPFLIDAGHDEMIRFGLSEPEIIPDSKQWECAMMMRAFSAFDVVGSGRLFAGIGAGVEQTTFALANKGCITFPTDRYLDLTPWSDTAPAPMMVRPQGYSNFAYEPGHVIPVHSDARVASLPDEFFDGVYSANSIEHFGSVESVAAAAEEMGRILKPGGVACISTEFRLDGPNGRGWFDDNCILFTPELIESAIVEPSGLQLVDELDVRTSVETYDSQVVLADFLGKKDKIGTIADKRDTYPNLVLFHEGYLFCLVCLTLRKPAKSPRRGHGDRALGFKALVDENAIATAGVLTQQISDWRDSFERDDSKQKHRASEIRKLDAELAAARTRLDALEAAHFKAERFLLGMIGDASGEGSSEAVIGQALADEREFGLDLFRNLVGEATERGFESRGLSGVLCFGPYVDLGVGHYRVVFGVQSDGLGGNLRAEVTSGVGAGVHGVATFDADHIEGGVYVDFSLAVPAAQVEFRLIVEGPADICLAGVKLLRRHVVIS